MRILVSGASGFIGKPLVQFLQAQKYEVVRLIRRESVTSDEIGWNSPKEQFENFDAVVNLAGESIFSLRWTKSKKQKILESRERSTLFLSTVLAHAARPPEVFLSASAIGFYGNRGEEVLDETAPQGSGFLAEVASRWEAACEPIRQRGLRVVHPRFGVVLGKGGGALQNMLLAFRLGLGGPLGSGSQWMSWIALEDVISSIYFALTHPTLAGPFIAASPNPVRQIEFAKELARFLHRPAFIRFPKWLLRLISGEAADELLLSSIRAMPKKLLEAGFRFAYPSLDNALRASL